MSKTRLFESFLEWFQRDKDEHSLEASFAGCTVRLIGGENIKMMKDASVEYYIISVGMHHIVFNVIGKYPLMIRQQVVNKHFHRWRKKRYIYTRWYDI
ncbi:MAG: hypothetical protein WHF31_15320 [Candidatus Dehalobacter alkaniphilus]